ncbi:hypothetical protein, partial [Corynebacterium sanguinis]|uniref:hypothetical protein n=1 Tax=Corynebacterium sanguinis TaxID=2594913 RepID=UPI0021A815F1
RRNSELVKSPNPTKTNHTTPQEKPARQYWQNLQFKNIYRATPTQTMRIRRGKPHNPCIKQGHTRDSLRSNRTP